MKIEEIEKISSFRDATLTLVTDISKILPELKIKCNNFIEGFINKWETQIKKITNDKSFIDSGIGIYISLFVHTLDISNFIDIDQNIISKKSIISGCKLNGERDYYFPPFMGIRFEIIWNACSSWEKDAIASKLNEMYLYGYPTVFRIGIEKFKISKIVKYFDKTKSVDDYSELAKKFVEDNISKKGEKLNNVFNDLLDAIMGELKNKNINPSNIIDMGIDKISNLLNDSIEKTKEKLKSANITPQDMKELELKLQTSAEKNKEMMIVMLIFSMIKKNSSNDNIFGNKIKINKK